jgi:hypothetical protein
MTRRQFLALGPGGLLFLASPVFAHHVWPVSRDKAITLRGTVTSYTFANPHVMIGLDVTDDGGRVEKWQVGGPSTARMAGNGWGRETLKGGEVITAVGYQFSDGQKILRLDKVVMPGGKEMFLYGRG